MTVNVLKHVVDIVAQLATAINCCLKKGMSAKVLRMLFQSSKKEVFSLATTTYCYKRPIH